MGHDTHNCPEKRTNLLVLVVHRGIPYLPADSLYSGLPYSIHCIQWLLLISTGIQVQVFSRVPVIVGTYINRVTCHPEDVSAKLWLACGAAGEVERIAADTAVPEQETLPSVMLYENLTED